jgi:hypothetical protein
MPGRPPIALLLAPTSRHRPAQENPVTGPEPVTRQPSHPDNLTGRVFRAVYPDRRNRSWRQSTQNRRNDTLTDP